MASVLVVEDDPGVRDMLELTLATEGFATEVAVDGEEAIGRLDRDPVDLVILDIMMPGIDGFAVLKELRARARWAGVPVIVATARGEDDDVWAGWAAGADYYLVKPFDLDELRRVCVRLVADAQRPG